MTIAVKIQKEGNMDEKIIRELRRKFSVLGKALIVSLTDEKGRHILPLIQQVRNVRAVLDELEEYLMIVKTEKQSKL